MSKYRMRQDAVDIGALQVGEIEEGSGWWLNHRSMPFDNWYMLKGESLGLVEEIGNVCEVAERQDTRQKLAIIIANLLRYRDRRPVEMALKTTESTMSPLVRKLEDSGFLNVKRGNEKIARNSKVWPTKKLLDCFEKVLSSDLVVNPPANELVILKDGNGEPKAYKDTTKTLQIRKILRKANEVNRIAEILYRKQAVSTALYAIFHRKFTLYGRLHTTGCYHYQGFSESKREKITINGEDVVELDFSGLHPRLLYALEGEQFDYDPYSVVLDDPELRDFMKKCLLALLNAKGCKVPGRKVNSEEKRPHYRKAYRRSAEVNAEGGINRRIGESQKWKNRLEKYGITKASEIIELFKEKHEPIAHHFCADNDNGLRMMNKDASIALDVVDHFATKGIPILAIHDSFIVQKQYCKELQEIMAWAYNKNTGNQGFTCPVTRN